jgi:chromosome segregation ATPase
MHPAECTLRHNEFCDGQLGCFAALDMQGGAAQSTQRVQELQAQLEKTEKEKIDLTTRANSTISRAKNDRARFEQQIKTLQQTIEQLQGEVREATMAKAAAQKEVQEGKSQLTAVQHRLEAATKQLESSRAELEAMRRSASEASQQRQAREAQLKRVSEVSLLCLL